MLTSLVIRTCIGVFLLGSFIATIIYYHKQIGDFLWYCLEEIIEILIFILTIVILVFGIICLCDFIIWLVHFSDPKPLITNLLSA